MSASSRLSLEAAQQDRDYWGRLVESAVGAHLVNGTKGKSIEVFYWLERNREVDFVLRAGNHVAAIEVKSGRRRERLLGMEAFSKAFRVKRQLLVGEQGIPVGEFLKTPVERWVD